MATNFPSMDGSAVSLFVADAASAIGRFIDVFVTVYSLLILAYILLSWFRLPYSPVLQKAQQFLHDACDPYLRIFRRFIPPLGPLDLSPIIAIIVLQVANQLVQRALDRV